jgi:hypothetical protein
VETKGIAASERDALMNLLEQRARGSGFEPVTERRVHGAPWPGFTSSYVKVLSERWRDYTTIHIFYFASEGSLTVDVENRLRGMEPPLKAELDALGDVFHAEMTGSIGAERVPIERARTSIPLLY